MLSDPIGDMLIRIKNSGLAGRSKVVMPYSKLKHKVAEILQKENYINEVSKNGKHPKQDLVIKLKYKGKKHNISEIKRKSRPGLRIYINHKSIPVVLGGMGMAVVSTSKGIMTGDKAKKQGLGGELLFVVW